MTVTPTPHHRLAAIVVLLLAAAILLLLGHDVSQHAEGLVALV